MGKGRLPNKLTPERRDEMDRALEAANGELYAGAAILGCHHSSLKRWIQSDDVMMRKWKPEWIADEDIDESIHKPRQLTASQRRDLAIAKEEQGLSGGFRELGVPDETIKYLVSVAEFANGKMDSITQLLTGGMSVSALSMIDLIRQLKADADKLALDPSKYDEVNPAGTITYSGWKKLKDVRDQIKEMTKEFRNLSKQSREMQIDDAKIKEIRRRQMEDAAKPKKSAGFGGPPEVFGNTPNLTQHVHNHS